MSTWTDTRDRMWASGQAAGRSFRAWIGSTWAGMSGEVRVGLICFGVGFAAGALLL